jgi:Winged helix DNA-binding domain
VRATILLDGFVEGAWKMEREKGAARLVIEPFRPLTAAEQDALAGEGERLARFCEEDAAQWEVSFAAPP